jgi:hypothetical protein
LAGALQTGRAVPRLPVLALVSFALAPVVARAATAPALAIPALPSEGQTLGLLVVGPPTPAGLAARGAVRVFLEVHGHHVVLLPSTGAPPHRDDVLKLCAERTLDGVAFVKISTAPDGISAEVELRDMNGDLYSEVVSSDGLAAASSRRESKAQFAIPDVRAPPSRRALEASTAPAANAPPAPEFVWFEDHGAVAVLGEARLADGEVYRVLGRPDLQARYVARAERKTTLRGLGGVALALGLLAGPPALLVAALCDHDCAKADAFAIGAGALFYGGVVSLIVAAATDPEPVEYRQRLSLARDYNKQRLGGSRASLLDVSVAPTPGGGAVLIGGRF